MNRGEIWLINLVPTIGSEIKKTRPAVIVNVDELGKLPLKVIVPITDWKEHYQIAPWMVRIENSKLMGSINYLRQIVFRLDQFLKKDL